MSGRLLVVDDEPRFCDFVRRVAVDIGYRVETVDDGRSFKDRFAEFAPDIVVIDLVLPDIDGFELVVWLAERQATCRVIVATGYAREFAARAKSEGEAKGLPPITILIKPVADADLRRAISVGEEDR